MHRSARRPSELAGALVVVVALGLTSCSGGSDASGDGEVEPIDAASSTTSPDSVTPTSEPAEVATGIEVAWATTLTGATREDEIDGIAADHEGALWVTGKFERTTTLGGEALTSAGAADIPLARFDREGAPQWVRSFGGTGEDNLFDIDAVGDTAVGTGWFEGTVAFDDIELTSAGSTDCVVVAFDGDGSVRWASAYGGPGPDGCNEVVVSDDGSVTTSMDTAGGWDSPAGPVGTASGREVVLLHLDADGQERWSGLVSGPGNQRGKSLAVADDGTVALGGDATGDVQIGDLTAPLPGARADAWVSLWSPDGEPTAVTAWGGPGADIAKGVAFGAEGLWAVGQFEGRIDLGGVEVDAGTAADLAVVRLDLERDLAASWVGSVRAELPLAGAEVTSAPDGGVLFGTPVQPGAELVAADGAISGIEGEGAAALVWWSPDGSARGWAIEGTATLGSDEIARAGHRVYLELVIRGDGNVAAGEPLVADAKDGSVWALDLVPG